MKKTGVLNSVISTLGFCVASGSSLLLFIGLFTARIEYTIEHWEDTVFVITLGLLTPIAFLVGVVFLFRSYVKKEYLIMLPLVMGVLSLFATLLYFSGPIKTVYELLRVNL